METAVGIVDELLESDAANDSVIRKRLVRLRQLLSDERASRQALPKVDRTASGDVKDEDGGSGRPALRPHVGPGKGKVTGYCIKNNNGSEFLDEERDGYPPFRVPREVYDAAVRAIAGATGPIQFKVWLEAVQKLRKSDAEPEYRLRVIVRFWLLKGLLKKEGTRYRTAGQYTKRFADAAKEEWAGLPCNANHA